MKYILSLPLFVFGFALLAVSAVSAQDVIFSEDTVVSIDGNNYTIISGSEADEVVVGTTTLTVSIPDGSTFTFKSSDRFVLNSDTGTGQTCTELDNRLVLQGPKTNAVITPDATTTCTIPSGSSTPTRVATSTGSVSISSSQEGETAYTTSDGTESRIFIPKGALSLPTVFTIEQRSQDPAINHIPSSLTLVPGMVFSYTTAPGPGTTVADPSTLDTFNIPVTISFSFLKDQVPENPERMGIYRYNEETETWEKLITSYNSQTYTFSAETLHFTLFALLESQEEQEISEEVDIEEIHQLLTQVSSLVILVQEGMNAGVISPAQGQNIFVQIVTILGGITELLNGIE